MIKRNLLIGFLIYLMISSYSCKLISQSQTKPIILFDEYRSARSPSNFIDLLYELQKIGYNLEVTDEKTDLSLLSKEICNVFVIFLPKRHYSDIEIEAIKIFVENGGGLIIFGDNGTAMRKFGISNPINEISSIFGIKFNTDNVEDDEKNIDSKCRPILSNFVHHPVTQNVKNIAWCCGCSLTLESPAIALGYGNETTTAGEKRWKKIVILAAAEYGKGRILAIGDTDFLVGPNTKIPYEYDIPNWLFLFDNKILVLNMFKWVTPPETTPPETTPPETTPPETTPPETTPPETTEYEEKIIQENQFEKFISWVEDLPLIRLFGIVATIITIPAAIITIMLYIKPRKKKV